jgi:hypothetical protein
MKCQIITKDAKIERVKVIEYLDILIKSMPPEEVFYIL